MITPVYETTELGYEPPAVDDTPPKATLLYRNIQHLDAVENEENPLPERWMAEVAILSKVDYAMYKLQLAETATSELADTVLALCDLIDGGTE